MMNGCTEELTSFAHTHIKNNVLSLMNSILLKKKMHAHKKKVIPFVIMFYTCMYNDETPISVEIRLISCVIRSSISLHYGIMAHNLVF